MLALVLADADGAGAGDGDGLLALSELRDALPGPREASKSLTLALPICFADFDALLGLKHTEEAVTAPNVAVHLAEDPSLRHRTFPPSAGHQRERL